MLNARRLGVEHYDYVNPRPRMPVFGKLLWTGNYSDIIRIRVSDALRRTDSGDHFITKPIFIDAETMIRIDYTYLRKYSKVVDKMNKSSIYPVVKDDKEYYKLDTNFIVKKDNKFCHITEWYLCETFVLDPWLDVWWGVASRAHVGQSVEGQANTTILTGERGSIRFKYNWYFQELTISGKVNPSFNLPCIHELDRLDPYRNFHAELLELPYMKYFIWKGMVCRVVKVDNFYMPTKVKYGDVIERQGYSYILCVPVEVHASSLILHDRELSDLEVNDLSNLKQCFKCKPEKIMANLADPFQLIHVTQIRDVDYNGTLTGLSDISQQEGDEKYTALWNVKYPLCRAGQRLYDWTGSQKINNLIN